MVEKAELRKAKRGRCRVVDWKILEEARMNVTLNLIDLLTSLAAKGLTLHTNDTQLTRFWNKVIAGRLLTP